jgi:hypothetical protein
MIKMGAITIRGVEFFIEFDLLKLLPFEHEFPRTKPRDDMAKK